MKKQSLLFVLSMLVLTGCQGTPSSTSTSTSATPIDFAQKFNYMKGNLKLSGTLTYKFYNLNEETGEFTPTSGDPLTTNLNVEFTDAGYLLSYNGDFDENFTETLFKSEDNTIELRYINNNNELEISRPKDKDGNEYDFAPYTNPFKNLTNDDLLISEDGKSASFDLNEKSALANDFVSTLTWYTFQDTTGKVTLDEVTLLADDEKVTGVHIATPVLSETLRNGTYTFDLTVSATGEDVVGPVTPTPVISEDEAKLAKLKTALEEIASSDYEASLVLTTKYGYDDTTIHQKIYKNSKGALSIDEDNATYQNGFYEADDGTFYQVTYSNKISALGKFVTSKSKEDSLPKWLLYTVSLYETTENENEFKISSEVSADSLQEYGFLQGIQNSYELAMTESFTIQLNEEGHVASVHFTGEFIDGTLTITKMGDVTLPFNFDELPLI